MISYSPTGRLTRHFTHREVRRSQTADRWGIDNTPDPCGMTNALLLARNVLEPVRTEFGRGFSPSSWFRCEELERKLCFRAYHSWLRRMRFEDDDIRWAQYLRKKSHPTGCAADIEIAGVSNDVLYQFIHENLEYDQLIREYPRPHDPMSGWVHVSFDITGNRGQAFTIGG